MMVYGREAFRREGPIRRYFVLSPEGMSLANQVITERQPTSAELKELESLGRWRRERRLKKLTAGAAPIKEGLVPFPIHTPASSRWVRLHAYMLTNTRTMVLE